MSTSHDSYSYSSSHTEPLLDDTTTYDEPSHIDVTRGNLNHNNDDDDDGIVIQKKYCRCCTRKQAIGCIICCTIFSIIIIIMICMIYLVIVPYMAQKQVDQSSITFDRMSLSNPRGESFTIDVLGSLHSESPFNADIDSTVMSLYYTYPDPSNNSTNSSSTSTISPRMIESRIGFVRFPTLALNKGDANVVIDTKTVFDIVDGVGFHAFMVDLVHSNTTSWRLRGDLTVHIHITSFLTISVSNIHLDKTTTIKGMHGLRDANLTVLTLDVVGGDANSVWLLPTLSINDTSDIELDMVPDGVTLNLIYHLDGVGDIVVGNGTVSDFSIRKGVSVLSTIIHVYHQSEHPTLIQRLLSDYIGGMDIPIRVTGAANAVPQFPYMTKVLQTLQLPAILPGIHARLIKRAFIHIWFDSLYQLDTAMEFQNIWSVTLAITGCDVAVLWKGEPVGRANQIFPIPVVAPPFTKVVSNTVPVVIQWGPTFFEALNEMKSGSILLDIEGKMDIAVYGTTGTPYRDTIYYKQLDINVTIANANTPIYQPILPTEPPTSSPDAYQYRPQVESP